MRSQVLPGSALTLDQDRLRLRSRLLNSAAQGLHFCADPSNVVQGVTRDPAVPGIFCGNLLTCSCCRRLQGVQAIEEGHSERTDDAIALVYGNLSGEQLVAFSLEGSAANDEFTLCYAMKLRVGRCDACNVTTDEIVLLPSEKSAVWLIDESDPSLGVHQDKTVRHVIE